MAIRRQAFNPCESGLVPLVGAPVFLYQQGLEEAYRRTITDADGWYEFTGLPWDRYETEVDYPECSGRRDLTDTDHVVSNSNENQDTSTRFYKAGDICDSKLVSEKDAVPTVDSPHFDALVECCANEFWHDMEGCVARSRVAALVATEDEATMAEYSVITSDKPRFYATYVYGQLCHSKTLFDSWEKSHVTLKECCHAHFSWDYDACCRSLDMGGC